MTFLTNLEFPILYYIQTLRTPWLDTLMVTITSLGDKGIFWLALSLLLIFIKKTRTIGIAMLISIILGFLLGNVWMKNLFQRQRPCWIDSSILLLVHNPKDFSFPSGHSLVSWEGAISIYLQNKKWGIPAIVLAVLITISRLYLFVHFPTDVIAGSLMGTAIAYIIYRLYPRR